MPILTATLTSRFRSGSSKRGGSRKRRFGQYWPAVFSGWQPSRTTISNTRNCNRKMFCCQTLVLFKWPIRTAQHPRTIIRECCILGSQRISISLLNSVSCCRKRKWWFRKASTHTNQMCLHWGWLLWRWDCSNISMSAIGTTLREFIGRQLSIGLRRWGAITVSNSRLWWNWCSSQTLMIDSSGRRCKHMSRNPSRCSFRVKLSKNLSRILNSLEETVTPSAPRRGIDKASSCNLRNTANLQQLNSQRPSSKSILNNKQSRMSVFSKGYSLYRLAVSADQS